MGKHEELMVAVRRADVTAVSKLLAKNSGSKSSMFCCENYLKLNYTCKNRVHFWCIFCVITL